MAAKWRAYLRTRDRSSRDDLIESYLFLVRNAARQIYARLGGRVSVDELESAGVLGLMDAVDSFDPDRGIGFETFGVFRIRGAMLDEVRAMDWVPRSVRVAERKLLDGRAAVAQALGRAATNVEVAEHLSLPLDRLLKMDRESQAARVVSFSALTSPTRGADSPRDPESDLLRATAAQDRSARDVRDELCQTYLPKLARTERLIVTLYYVEGLTLQEIGRSLDLSESRVSQIHTRALCRLRELAGVATPARAPARRLGRPPGTGNTGPGPALAA
jgi:RNA polymerase sigma factor for flagellar operon FliA